MKRSLLRSTEDVYKRQEYTRRHNDANALCMGGRVVGAGLACQLVDIFLNTQFEGGRHPVSYTHLVLGEEGTKC